MVAPPPEAPLRLTDTKRYRIDSPLWNHRAEALIVNWIPHCIEQISDPDLREGGINNFVDAARKLAESLPPGVFNTPSALWARAMTDLVDGNVVEGLARAEDREGPAVGRQPIEQRQQQVDALLLHQPPDEAAHGLIVGRGQAQFRQQPGPAARLA